MLWFLINGVLWDPVEDVAVKTDKQLGKEERSLKCLFF